MTGSRQSAVGNRDVATGTTRPVDGDILREAQRALDRMGDLTRRVGNLVGVVVILTVVSLAQLGVIAWLIKGRIAAGAADAATAVLKGLGP